MNLRYLLRLLSSVFVALFVLCSTSQCVLAAEIESIEGFWFNDESVPMYNDGMNFYSDVNGYTFSWFYVRPDGQGYYWYDATSELQFDGNGNYTFGIQLILPEPIARNEIFDLDFAFNFNVDSVNSGYMLMYDGLMTGYDRHEIEYKYANNSSVIKAYDCTRSSDSVQIIRIFIDTTISSSRTLSLVPTYANIEVVESESGLLNGIIQWLTSIRDNIVELPSKIANSVSGFFQNVVDAVTNLGTMLLDGIKGLFVPSEEDITNMSNKWDTLLEDRFGGLYQSIDIIHDYADGFTERSKNTIEIPSISVPVAGSSFAFGGWSVKIVPDGFSFLFDALKLIISILATFSFVNAMKSRLEKLIGGSDNI